MGLFGNKDLLWCDICNTRTGTPENKKHKTQDGIICHDCFQKAGYQFGMVCFADTSESIRQAIENRKTIQETFQACKDTVAAFQPTRSVGGRLFINDDTNEWYVQDSFYMPSVRTFSDLLESWVDVDRTQTTVTTTKKSGVGRAVVGSLIAGPTGALVGAVTGKEKGQMQTELMEEVTVGYRVRDTAFPLFISGISGGQANNIKAALDEMMNGGRPTTSATSMSAADELRKYKSLLDDNIITQGEFEAKKKQLLGL